MTQQNGVVRYRLPDAFEVRYTLGRVAEFLPVFTAILIFACCARSPWAPLIAIKYVVILGFLGYFSWRRASSVRTDYEDWVARSVDIALRSAREESRSIWFPMTVASLVAALTFTAIRNDWRPAAAIGLLLAFLMLGYLLKWFVYSKWLLRHLPRYDITGNTFAQNDLS
jgi:hypothetical protein